MTKRYTTPDQGTLDWHIPLNENFDQLNRDIPVLDAEANRDTHAPHEGLLFIATDTGRRYVGDGEAWTELPYPTDGDTSTETTTDTSGPTADIVVSRTSDPVLAERDGSELASGDADSVLEAVVSDLSSGETVHIESGTYVISSMKILTGLSDVTWRSEGTIRLDDGGSSVKSILRIDSCENVLVDGGTYDFDKQNNTDDGLYGTQFILSPRNSSGVEIKNTRLLNAFNGFSGGNGISDLYIHDNYMQTSDERGVYHSGASKNIEVGNNTIRDVRSGALRSNESPTGWYIHDNDIEMRDTFGPVYLFEGGCSDITIERDTAICRGSGSIWWSNNVDYHGNPEQLTIRDGHYEAPDGPIDFAVLRPEDSADVSGITFSGNDLVNIGEAYPEAHS